MRLTLCFLLLLGFYFLLSNGENPKKSESQRISPTNRPSTPRRSLNRVRNARRQQRIKRASKVVCSYALNGKWPPYPKRLRQMVSIQSRRILVMSKEDIKSYCGKLNNPSTTRRPTKRPQFTTTRFTTRRPFYQFTTQKFYPQTQFPTVSTTKFPYFTIPFIFTTSRPTTPSTSTPSTSLSTTTPTTTTFSITTPSTVSTTLSTTTPSLLNRGIILPLAPISTTIQPLILPLSTVSTSTTTTQKAPTGSASAYYYSGSGSSYYSGSGSAYYSATGSLTANTEDQSSRLTRKSNDVAIRSFKAKNGDIIIKWTPGGGKLKKISDK